ncbi:hypothetical protein FRX31_013766 [Thalictrum thalictroides]|uniref:Uncharacterized protein n=1 Tax=Thalictrum thalictroides TaxID=46969 RepID=A0A7J6WJJ8_THATH|nr:hypothetical protein FRX31_013766 [Thalictrum thalictroides]
MTATIHVHVRSTITTTIYLQFTLMVLACTIHNVMSQGSMTDCFNKCGGDMLMYWPKYPIAGVLFDWWMLD